MTMKRVISATLVLCATGLSGVTQAQTAASPASSGVVTMSFNTVVLQTAEAQKELNALQSKYAPRQAQLKALNDEIQGLQKQLETTGDKLNDVERASREQSLATKEKQLQRDTEDYRTDTQADQQQVFQSVAQKVYPFLQSYAQQHGYSVVVERGSDAAPVVWYSAANLDITGDLIKAFNAQSGTATPASASRPAAPRPSSTPAQKPQSTSPAPK